MTSAKLVTYNIYYFSLYVKCFDGFFYEQNVNIYPSTAPSAKKVKKLRGVFLVIRPHLHIFTHLCKNFVSKSLFYTKMNKSYVILS